ncbi:MAG: hypothetical protein M5U05_18875 [Anaerolineales bacterium]|nr:hypothetical protein [Anaerolineales bacterium]
MSNKAISVYAQAMQREQEESTQESTWKTTREPTVKPTPVLDNSRDIPRENSREVVRDLPSRDDIQGFSFRLRDELKVKVQAEVPHEWQQELDDLARQLNVKKLELYRYIIGDFLGKVEQPDSTGKE